MSKKITYKDAGVDVLEGARAVDLMKSQVRSTFTKGVIGDIGSFGGLFRLGSDYENPVLVSGTDGVGTKLKLAFQLDIHDSVGIDLVAMSVNDILCQGAKPLFFLDYIATGKVEAEKISQIVKGIAEGCRQSSAALLGGETAEMSGFYEDGEYDLAGFAVGVVEESQIIDGSKIKVGDKVLYLPSSGPHSNGYSLIRKLFENDDLYAYNSELGETLGEALLKPTKIYAKEITRILNPDTGVAHLVNGIIHMTGGGYYENIPRCIPDGLCAEIHKSKIHIPKIFKLIQSKGVEEDEMYRTFNMGAGMILITDPNGADAIIKDIGAHEIGQITKSSQKVAII